MFKRFAAAFSLALAAPAVADDPPSPPRTDLVVLETALGDITLAIETERARVTAANFL